jgi:hypothetical protein
MVSSPACCTAGPGSRSAPSSQLAYFYYPEQDICPVAKFLVPDWGDLVDSGIGLSYRHDRLHMAGGPVRQPYASVYFIPSSGTKNFASAQEDTQQMNTFTRSKTVMYQHCAPPLRSPTKKYKKGNKILRK